MDRRQLEKGNAARSGVIRVVVGGPYAAVRAGLRSMLEGASGIVVVGEAASDVPFAPDVLVSDVGQEDPPDGVALVALIGDAAETRRLVGRTFPWAALLREADAEDLEAAVRAVASGLIAIDPVLWPAAMGAASSPAPDTLTNREREVLRLIAEGLPNKTIAIRLGVSLHTVKFHVAALFAKLGATSRTEAVTLGLRGGHIAV